MRKLVKGSIVILLVMFLLTSVAAGKDKTNVKSGSSDGFSTSTISSGSSAVTIIDDNSQSDTKTEYGSTVTITGPEKIFPNKCYNIVLNATTDAPIYQWSFYEDSVRLDGSGFTWGSQFTKTFTLTKSTLPHYTYTFNFKGIMGAHGWPPYTTVTITVDFTSDTTPPVVTITSPQQGAEYDWGQTFTVGYTAADSDSGIKEVSARIDTTLVTNASQIQTSDLGYGNHIIIVNAINHAGLETTGYATFKVNVSATAVETIMDDYVAQDLIDSGTAQSLQTKLNQGNNDNGAAGRLNAFQNELATPAAGKHIDGSIMPFLSQLAKNNLANISTPTADLPETLPYIFKPGSYAKITLPCGATTQIPLTGEATMAFSVGVLPNTIDFNVTGYTVQTTNFQVGGNNIIYTSWLDPNTPSTGSINLITGLVTEHIATIFTLDVGGNTYGPYNFAIDLVGVQQWSDIYSANLYFYGSAQIPSTVPHLGGARVETSQGKHMKSIESFTLYSKLEATLSAAIVWKIVLSEKATEKMVRITFFYETYGEGNWTLLKKEASSPQREGNQDVYYYTASASYDGDVNEDASYRIIITATPTVCNPETRMAVIFYTPGVGCSVRPWPW